MSVSTTTAPPAHFLLRRTDDRGRVGSLHAAVAAEVGFLTACGAPIDPARAKAVETWTGAEAFAVLDAPGARHCARCVRVGDALDEP